VPDSRQRIVGRMICFQQTQSVHHMMHKVNLYQQVLLFGVDRAKLLPLETVGRVQTPVSQVGRW
jgi:hypothetical protein